MSGALFVVHRRFAHRSCDHLSMKFLLNTPLDAASIGTAGIADAHNARWLVIIIIEERRFLWNLWNRTQ